MTIAIYPRLKPFSHEKGGVCLMPGATTFFTIYPCKVSGLDGLSATPLFTLELFIKNFYKEFTVEVDFDKRFIRVFGQAERGFIEYKIYKKDKELFFELLRGPEEGIEACFQGKMISLYKKSPLKLAVERLSGIDTEEQIHFGYNKKQEMGRLFEARAAGELFPYLFVLGSALKLPNPPTTVDLLADIEHLDAMHEGPKQELIEKIVQGHYREGFIPSFNDIYCQGLSTALETKLSGLYLTQSFSTYIKKSLARFEEGHLYIFQGLPKELIVGRAIHLKLPFGKLHLEWTKGFIRQVVLDIKQEMAIHLVFPKGVKSFRIRKNKKVIAQPEVFEVGVYHLDAFQA